MTPPLRAVPFCNRRHSPEIAHLGFLRRDANVAGAFCLCCDGSQTWREGRSRALQLRRFLLLLSPFYLPHPFVRLILSSLACELPNEGSSLNG